MSINGINPILGAGLASAAGASPASPADEPVRHPAPEPVDTTNVIVEMPTTNTVVYQFVDTSSGQLIEQIPSQAMLNFANAIDEALPSLRAQEEQD